MSRSRGEPSTLKKKKKQASGKKVRMRESDQRPIKEEYGEESYGGEEDMSYGGEEDYGEGEDMDYGEGQSTEQRPFKGNGHPMGNDQYDDNGEDEDSMLQSHLQF